MRKSLLMLTAAALVLVPATVAPAQEREEREQRRLEQAQQAMEQAIEELRQAMEFLRQEESADARRRLQDALRELREAERQLGPYYIFRTPTAWTTTLGRSPQMGVYLRSSRDPAKDSIGAELTQIVRGGPADEAGLKPKDIITEANGERLGLVGRRGESPRAKLIGMKNRLEVGDTLHVEYRRGDETHTADIVLDRIDSPFSVIGRAEVALPEVIAPDEIRVAPRLEVGPLIGRIYPRGWLDMELVTLDDDLAAYFGTDEGLLVIRAPREETFQLRSGDVILNIDGRKVTSQSHLMRIVRSYEPGEEMQIEIMRNQRRQTLTVTVPERDRGFDWDWDWELRR